MAHVGKLIDDLLKPDTSDSYRTRPVSGTVTTVNTDNDMMGVEAYTSGTPTVGVPHPYTSLNSWIRCYPETGASLLIAERAEDRTFVAIGYYRDSPFATEREGTDAVLPTSMRRKMYVGEIEIASTNQGQIYADRRGNLEMRSGLMRHHINQDRLEEVAYTGTHIREVSGRQVGIPGLTDQERFGLIKRSPVNAAFEAYFGGPESKLPTTPFRNIGSPVMGKEYVRNISVRPAAGMPSLLPIVDHREGTTVVNDQGAPDLVPIGTAGSGGPVTGPFRFRSRWFVLPNASTSSVAPFTCLDVGMDLKGNVGINLPVEGNLRLSVVGPQGGAIDIAAGASWSLLVGAQGMKTTSAGNVAQTAPFIQFNTPGGSPTVPGASPVARVGDLVNIDCALLAAAIAPLLAPLITATALNSPCVPTPSPLDPPPLSVAAGTVLTGNTTFVA